MKHTTILMVAIASALAATSYSTVRAQQAAAPAARDPAAAARPAYARPPRRMEGDDGHRRHPGLAAVCRQSQPGTQALRARLEGTDDHRISRESSESDACLDRPDHGEQRARTEGQAEL